MDLIKTVRVTNPKNVIVQIPGIVSGIEWGVKLGDMLEVSYDDDSKEVRIRPYILGRGDAAT